MQVAIRPSLTYFFPVIFRARPRVVPPFPSGCPEIKNLQDQVFIADPFRFALQAQVAVIGGQAGQGVDLHHAWVALFIEADICAGDIERIQNDDAHAMQNI